MTLSRDDVTAIVRGHFADLGEDAVQTMVAIVFAESGGDPAAVNDNFPRWQPDPASPYRYDYGLAQINSVHGFDADRLLWDPDYNLASARAVFDRQGFNAWTTYRVGAHLRYYQAPPPPPPSPPPAPDVPARLDLRNDEDVRAVLHAIGTGEGINGNDHFPKGYDDLGRRVYEVHVR